MIDLRLLQAAVTVAEERSITRAAERLGLTQSALSKQLADLEDRVGFVLFERNSQRFAITDAGANFVEHARAALAEIGRAVQTGRAAALGAENIICVARSPYIDPYFVSVMRTIRLPLYPSLELRFSSHFSNEALRMLRSGDADLAITSGLQEQSGVSSNKIAVEAFFVALAGDDPLCEKREIQLSDLHHRRLALLERQVNPPVYDKLQQVLASEAVHPSEVHHIQRAEEAAELVLQTKCIALLTKTSAWRISDGLITLRPLRDQRLQLNTYLSVRLEEESRLLSEFLRIFNKRLVGKPKQTNLPLAG